MGVRFSDWKFEKQTYNLYKNNLKLINEMQLMNIDVHYFFPCLVLDQCKMFYHYRNTGIDISGLCLTGTGPNHFFAYSSFNRRSSHYLRTVSIEEPYSAVKQSQKYQKKMFILADRCV